MPVQRSHGQARPQPPRANELPSRQTAEADPIQSGRDSKGRIVSAAAASAMGRLPRRSKFIPRKLACDPRFEPHNRRRLEWQRRRVAELYAAHGFVSHGVGSMLAAAAWLYAGGEFAAELGAESGDLDLFKLSSTLTTAARGHELSAWEMCSREAVGKPKETTPVPWLVAPGEEAK